ncbi:LysR family transcriptional regulator [Streptomyces chengbuensis]|uniref:helix-turn-helix domain-containing protein n=1 Tax=Streptomyces TaxID=1883 RepID=UPI0025B2907E|nr:LysR family transcriptional regulator [Streptomyces sp. HUAS CB01]WJY54586.1 LysR family transcriptional regulator [Streptomyces sp. HUAS CB01]
MRIEQLEYIAAVTRSGLLRRAAEETHLSQPALSETVRNLERELGVDLLERKRSGAKISDEGRELLSVYGQLPRLVASGRLTARSVADDLDGWWHGFFSFLASGPPGFRLRQLLALSRAGIVHFPGAGIRIATDETSGTFTATSPTVSAHTTHATALIEAYLPGPSLAHTEDPLLRGLYREGALAEEVIADPTHTHRSGLLAVSPTDGHVLAPSLDSPTPAASPLAPPPTAGPSPHSPAPAPTRRRSARTTRSPARSCLP